MMHISLFHYFAGVSTCFLLASAAAAQETPINGTGSMTASGMTLASELDALESELSTLPLLALKDRLAIETKLLAAHRELRQSHERRTSQQRECAELIRRANRDTLLKTALQCFRSHLMLELSLLRSIEQVSALTLDVAEHETFSITLRARRDAILALRDAIDADLFERMEDLEQAKNNLAERYSLPYWEASSRLRLLRNLSWVRLSAATVRTLMEKGLMPEEEQTLLETTHCFRATSESALAGNIYSFAPCRVQLRAAIRVHNQLQSGSGSLNN